MRLVNSKIFQEEILNGEFINEKNEEVLYSNNYIATKNYLERDNKLLIIGSCENDVSLHLWGQLWITITS